MIIQVSDILNDFLSLFIPSKCLNCGVSLNKHEKYLCKGCLAKIPKTNFLKDRNNPVSQLFLGRVNLESAFSFYFFSKGGSLQKLIHEIKYHGGKELAFELGKEFGHDLKSEGYDGVYDFICPVPLHKQKQRQRGYNQSEWLSKGIAEVLNVEVENNILYRKIFTSTQTKKNRQQRWDNVKDAFQVINFEKIEGKHVLLIDDVLTTGATIEACAQQLLSVKDTKVSVASLAFAFD